MLLQCVKCSLFFRTFPKIKAHKDQGICADKPKIEVKTEPVEYAEKEVDDVAAPADEAAAEPSENEPAIKKETVEPKEESDSKNPWSYNEIKEELNELSNKDSKEGVKDEPLDEKPVFKPLEGQDVYVPAPVVTLEDSDDEFEAESDESAPEEDDVETILGLARKRTFKTKIKKRKRLEAEGKIVFVDVGSGQRRMKFSSHKVTRQIRLNSNLFKSNPIQSNPR